MKTLEEPKEIPGRMQDTMNLRDDNNKTIKVQVGTDTCGITAGARPVIEAIMEEVAKRNLSYVMVTQAGCIGLCCYEPIVKVCDGYKETTYINMTPEKAVKMVNEHLVNNRVIEEYTIDW